MAKKPAKGESGELLVCRASKTVARYVIDERLEAGMVLTGSEVKSLRDRKADLEGAYARVERGELWLHKMYIGPYQQATAFAHEPKRSRKLLAHRQEIEKLTGKLSHQRRSRILLEVRETNLAAQLFFRKCGFRAVSVLRDFYEDTTEDAYLMQYRCEAEQDSLMPPQFRLAG